MSTAFLLCYFCSLSSLNIGHEYCIIYSPLYALIASGLLFLYSYASQSTLLISMKHSLCLLINTSSSPTLFNVAVISDTRFLRYDLWSSSSHKTAFSSLTLIAAPSLSIRYANNSLDLLLANFKGTPL